MTPLRLLRTHRYEIIAFLTGASIMTLEIVGARLIAPHFGATTYVWTAMIGVILAAMALGFALGGKLADRDSSARPLGLILFMAAMGVLAMAAFQESVLSGLAGMDLDIRLGALLAALILFALPSFLIGMVSPHLAKQRVVSLDSTGRSIGRLEAAGAFGSIAGTFLCGYFLLGFFGSRTIVVGIVAVLLLTSLLAGRPDWKRLRWSMLAIVIVGIAAQASPRGVLADVDSSYARYQVRRGVYDGVPTNFLITDDSGVQSASRANGSPALVLDYTRQFMRAADAQSGATTARTLVIGGGTYTFPSALSLKYPRAQVDAVEIDPALDGLARQYFGYKDRPNLALHHADGRTYLSRATATYDLIFMDAFSSLSPPFQLTTKESVGLVRDRLAADGAVVVNLIGRYEGGNGEYVRALAATYQQAFTNVSLHTIDNALPGPGRQNLILYASNSPQEFAAVTASAGNRPLKLAPGGLVLTDNYAPVERLTFR